VRLDPETIVPDHDPATLETHAPGLFVAGGLAAGRMTNRILIENGRFHGEAIVSRIVGTARLKDLEGVAGRAAIGNFELVLDYHPDPG
jgi:hypothetical protein